MISTIKNRFTNSSTMDMTKGKPYKVIIAFAIPLMIGNIFQQLYSMVDTMVVGRFIGTNALAAVGATSPVVQLLINWWIICSSCSKVWSWSKKAH